MICKVEDVLVDFAEGDVYSAGWKQWLSGGKFSLPTRARLIHRDGAGRCDPAGARTYRGGVSDANALTIVRRLIPSRRAISRCDTPSLANVLTSAHSNALTTSPSPPLVDHHRRA